MMDKVRRGDTVKEKDGKTPIHIILIFARVTELYLTTCTMESII